MRQDKYNLELSVPILVLSAGAYTFAREERVPYPTLYRNTPTSLSFASSCIRLIRRGL
jgi:hypothetical protein